MCRKNIPSTWKMRGGVTIEFTLVFIIFFMLFYSLVGYTLPLLLSASYQEVASDGLREAVDLHYVVAANSTEIDIPGRVNQLVARSWIPDKWRETCSGYGEGFLDRQDGIWRVCIRYSQVKSLLPPFTIFGWQVPALPDEIRGEAIMRVD